MKIINLLKNRTVLGILCIVLALILCFVVSPLISRTSENTVKIVRAVTEIKSGDKITQDMVAEVSMVGTNQPDNVLTDRGQVIGKYAAMDMTKGDYVLSSKVSETPYIENTYFAGLNGENRAISVTLKSFATGLSGKLKSGDIVSVIAPDYHKTGMTVVPVELQYVEVITVTGESGVDVEVTGESEEELPSTVTLLATEQQAKVLAELEKDGNMHLSLVYRGERETAQKFLQAQKEVLIPTAAEEQDTEDTASESGAGADGQ